MSRALPFLTGLLASLAFAVPASAAVRYASPSGSGAEPCTSAAPCALRKALVDAPANGTEVVVKSGNYTYDSTINVSKRLDVHGEAGQPRPRIAPASGVTDQAIVDSSAPGSGEVRFTRLDIRSTAASALHVFGTGVVLSDLILRSSTGTAVLFEGSGTRVMRDSVAQTTGAGGVALQANDGSLSVRNVTAFSGGSNSTGIKALGPCTLNEQGNCASPPGHPDLDVLNTIAHGNSSDLVVHADPTASAQIKIGHSNFATKTGEAAGAVIIDNGGNQSQSPAFVINFNISAFHQHTSSPTIDAGVADPLNGTTDYDGDPRTFNSVPDIGVDEYVGTDHPAPGGGDPGGGGGGSGGGDPGAGNPGGGPAETTVPLLTGFAIAPVKFRAAGTGPSAAAAAKVGATTAFSLSEPATVSFRVERRAAGRRAGKRCVKPTRRLRKRKRCARYVAVTGGFDRFGAAGPNSFKFSGRIADRKLRPGRYRLVATAADAAGNLSKAARAPFRIVGR
jgi:hypothetical protein